ncbi:MAG TPA: HPF/RaiA family ribosome-associated protein [Gemmatimonadaceae bacterium]|nr:HPF/RaiA family ribosome-associated protein [Gemmatimonadaceae bacterium]
MHVQVNTDSSVEATEELIREVEAAVESTLSRFADRVTRVEVHLSDVNSEKGGETDKRCLLEVRLAGRRPVAVSHRAGSVQAAVAGAAEKLKRALDRSLGRLKAY